MNIKYIQLDVVLLCGTRAITRYSLIRVLISFILSLCLGLTDHRCSIYRIVRAMYVVATME